MLNIANNFAKNYNGAIINSNEMLTLLQKKGVTVKNSDKEYVKYTDTVLKEVIHISKYSFGGRMTRIRKHINEKYPT